MFVLIALHWVFNFFSILYVLYVWQKKIILWQNLNTNFKKSCRKLNLFTKILDIIKYPVLKAKPTLNTLKDSRPIEVWFCPPFWRKKLKKIFNSIIIIACYNLWSYQLQFKFVLFSGESTLRFEMSIHPPVKNTVLRNPEFYWLLSKSLYQWASSIYISFIDFDF